jgi:hypothetical protein
MPIVEARIVTGSVGSDSHASEPTSCSTTIAVATSTCTRIGRPMYDRILRHDSERRTIIRGA